MLLMFQVEDIITRIALKGWEERYHVLSWALRTYPGPEMMADPAVGTKRSVTQYTIKLSLRICEEYQASIK